MGLIKKILGLEKKTNKNIKEVDIQKELNAVESKTEKDETIELLNNMDEFDNADIKEIITLGINNTNKIMKNQEGFKLLGVGDIVKAIPDVSKNKEDTLYVGIIIGYKTHEIEKREDFNERIEFGLFPIICNLKLENYLNYFDLLDRDSINRGIFTYKIEEFKGFRKFYNDFNDTEHSRRFYIYNYNGYHEPHGNTAEIDEVLIEKSIIEKHLDMFLKY